MWRRGGWRDGTTSRTFWGPSGWCGEGRRDAGRSGVENERERLTHGDCLKEQRETRRRCVDFHDAVFLLERLWLLPLSFCGWRQQPPSPTPPSLPPSPIHSVYLTASLKPEKRLCVCVYRFGGESVSVRICEEGFFLIIVLFNFLFRSENPLR